MPAPLQAATVAAASSADAVADSIAGAVEPAASGSASTAPPEHRTTELAAELGFKGREVMNEWGEGS